MKLLALAVVVGYVIADCFRPAQAVYVPPGVTFH